MKGDCSPFRTTDWEHVKINKQPFGSGSVQVGNNCFASFVSHTFGGFGTTLLVATPRLTLRLTEFQVTQATNDMTNYKQLHRLQLSGAMSSRLLAAQYGFVTRWVSQRCRCTALVPNTFADSPQVAVHIGTTEKMGSMLGCSPGSLLLGYNHFPLPNTNAV